MRKSVELSNLCFARSGDKGSDVNIGVIARNEEAYRFLVKELTESKVSDYFEKIGVTKVERFLLPNLASLNFILYNALGEGGSVSLKSDAQGKSLAQVLLLMKIDIDENELKKIEEGGWLA